MRCRGAVLLFMAASAGGAARGDEADIHYRRSDLATASPGMEDGEGRTLVGPWAFAHSPGGPWWIADETAGRATLYDGAGSPQNRAIAVPGAPTGMVFYAGDGFIVRKGPFSGAARLLFASEDGTISAWSPGVPAPAPSTEAVIVVDHREEASVYRGLALALATPLGDLLYATDVRNGRVDVYNTRFEHAGLGRGAFVDRHLPSDFAPFGIACIGRSIFVTYAQMEADHVGIATGPGRGYVDEYDLLGHFVRRVASRGPLDAPWAIALAPNDFGGAGGELLVGNTGDGAINVYDPRHLSERGRFRARGQLLDERGEAIIVPGLRGLSFGNEALAGPHDTLYYSAGLGDELGGAFGSLRSASRSSDEEDGD